MAIQADPTAPAQNIDDILITEVLAERAHGREVRSAREAFVALAEVMANTPTRLPQTLCDLALELCGAGSAGIAIIKSQPDGEPYFYWEALSGVFAGYAGGTTPRHFSLCGAAVDRGATQLFSCPGRLFTYLNDVSPAIIEALVVPFFAAGRPMGAIWILSHDEQGFDGGQAALMEDIGKFCGAAFALLGARTDAESVRASLEVRAELLSESNEVKDEFISLVAHELRSPVSTIFGNSRLLLERGRRLEDEDISQALRDIAQESVRLNRVLEDLLVLARPENGGPAVEPLHIRRIAERVIENHRNIYPERAIVINGGSDCLASGSADYVEQILHNLISNAEKYSPASEPIQVAIETGPGEVCVMVKDHGAGVAPAEAEPIFKMFYRSGDALEKASGMGIGLAVCKRLVEAQGGKIWVDAGKDGGSEFCFTLPSYADALE